MESMLLHVRTSVCQETKLVKISHRVKESLASCLSTEHIKEYSKFIMEKRWAAKERPEKMISGEPKCYVEIVLV